ncbi:MAG TPA: acyltransferase [Aliidongia sp.]|uniref:acyltransferase family protein n=1 Tax=Aliidongia sp. TaxID=1914230 RepID=UPI002DDDB207|nr:acyltransferase [Aliidongia sp.]HEV2678400.1 acyltransferase [Aliidongia sp.]
MLTEPLSVYLDLVRLCAALSVALSHVWAVVFPAHLLPWPGHDAVVVFFVLSGLVVAHATDRPDRPAAVYVEHRLARIWSVAIPALVLSAIAALFVPAGVTMHAATPITDVGTLWQALGLSAVFMAQSWNLDLTPPFNSPYWSLSFEVWYYALFGLWAYLHGRVRVLALLACAAMAGPKILLLMPVWLFGAAIYHARFRLSGAGARALFGVTLAAGLLFFWFDCSVKLRDLAFVTWPGFMATLHGANQFIGDTLLGLIVSAHFVAVANLRGSPAVQRAKAPLKLASSFTFSIYLYHMPLFALLWGAFGLRSPAIIFLFLGLAIIAIGMVTERKLAAWRGLIRRLIAGSTAARTAAMPFGRRFRFSLMKFRPGTGT